MTSNMIPLEAAMSRELTNFDFCGLAAQLLLRNCHQLNPAWLPPCLGAPQVVARPSHTLLTFPGWLE